MNDIESQKQKPLPVQTSENIDRMLNTHAQLILAREDFIARFGIKPSVMYVGSEVYKLGFPMAHSFPVKCWAIEDMLVVEKSDLDPLGILIPEQKWAEA